MFQCGNEEESGNRYGGLQVVTEPVEDDSAPKHTPARPSMYAVCQDTIGKNVHSFLIWTFTLCGWPVCSHNPMCNRF